MKRICVAVCTHDRPELLEQLLVHLVPQVTELRAALVLVDNGSRSVQAIADKVAPGHHYIKINDNGLVPARNTALREALALRADFIAFIDDDEIPDPEWLVSLFSCLEHTKADICCGPLRPRFLVRPPRWAEAGGFFGKSGSHIGTGNIMFRSSILPEDETQWFQSDFSRIGGEDEELFSRLISLGARFMTCNNAWVSEAVPADRLKLAYIMQTGLRDGAIAVALAGRRHQSVAGTASSIAWHVLAKLVYAGAHLVQLWRGSWHGVAALRDSAEIAGVFAALLGWRRNHY